MTKPVMPNDETLEYLPTQAIADFLASKSTPHMDGIIFPSAQTNSSGLNLVLFHKASQVEMIEVSDEENFSVQEDWEPNSETHSYHIIEDQPEHHRPTGTVFEINKGKKTSSPPLDLKYTLRIDLQKIEVCHIKAVKFESNDSAVIRYRSSSQNVYRK